MTAKESAAASSHDRASSRLSFANNCKKKKRIKIYRKVPPADGTKCSNTPSGSVLDSINLIDMKNNSCTIKEKKKTNFERVAPEP